MPIPRVDNDNILKKRLVKISGRLASKDERFSLWASQVGVDFGDLKEDEKEDKVCEIDALVSILYGFDESQIIHIFETFHEGWNYQPRMNKVLSHFHFWKNKI